MNKSEGRYTDEKYHRTSSFHSIDELRDSKTGINVNSELGKISLRAHLRKSDLKNYSLQLIDRIIGEMANVKESDISTYFKGIQLDDIHSFSNISKAGKEIAREIIIAINKMKFEGRTDISVNYSIQDLYSKLRKCFDFFFVPMCDSCGSHLYKCVEMDEFGLVKITPHNLNLFCSSCEKDVIDISSHFECGCGKKLEGTIEELVIAIPTVEFINILNDVVTEINLKYNIESNELVKISNNSIELIKINYKYLYSFDELPAFKSIPNLNEIEKNIANAQLYNVQNVNGGLVFPNFGGIKFPTF